MGGFGPPLLLQVSRKVPLMIRFITSPIALLAIVAAIVVLGVSFALAVVAEAKTEQHVVTICHNPPGNTDAAHTISISEHAWPAHKAHWDALGPCPVLPPRSVSPTIGGEPVPELTCQEDEVISFTGVDTLDCVHVEVIYPCQECVDDWSSYRESSSTSQQHTVPLRLPSTGRR